MNAWTESWCSRLVMVKCSGEVILEAPGVKLVQVDALTLLRSLPDGCIETVFFDGPYVLGDAGTTNKGGERVPASVEQGLLGPVREVRRQRCCQCPRSETVRGVAQPPGRWHRHCVMRLTSWIGCVALMFAVACDKSGETTNPVPATADASGDVKPPWTESTYVSKGDDEESKAGDDKEDDDVELEKPDDGKLRDAEKVRKIATDAAAELVDPYASTLMTPAFVTAWPSTDSKVMYIIYPLIPTQSSSTFKVGAPVKVTVSLLDGSTELEQLPKSKRLKTFEEKRFPRTEQDRVAATEQAVIELVLGEREFSRASGHLGEYEVWFFYYEKFATDLRTHIPKVLKWHRHPHE